MNAKYGLFALTAVLVVTSASAAGDNVVLIAVAKVTVPEKLPGACDLTGSVKQVWQGTAFHSNQRISFKVPCRGDEPSFIPAVAVLNGGPNIHPQSATVLRASHLGLARLDDSGTLIWEATSRTFGPWGTAYGYRVIDGVAMPANKQP